MKDEFGWGDTLPQCPRGQDTISCPQGQDKPGVKCPRGQDTMWYLIPGDKILGGQDKLVDRYNTFNQPVYLICDILIFYLK